MVHIDEGFDFLGFHIRRRRKRGTQKHYVFTTPSRKAIQAIKDKVKARPGRNQQRTGVDELLTGMNRSLRGWANYFRYGVSKSAFAAVDQYAWHRITRWIFHKHSRLSWPQLRRRFCIPGTWRLASDGVVFTGAFSVHVERYRFRGSNIPTPWTPTATALAVP